MAFPLPLAVRHARGLRFRSGEFDQGPRLGHGRAPADALRDEVARDRHDLAGLFGVPLHGAAPFGFMHLSRFLILLYNKHLMMSSVL
jgi:hypothetical protein